MYKVSLDHFYHAKPEAKSGCSLLIGLSPRDICALRPSSIPRDGENILEVEKKDRDGPQ